MEFVDVDLIVLFGYRSCLLSFVVVVCVGYFGVGFTWFWDYVMLVLCSPVLS